MMLNRGEFENQLRAALDIELNPRGFYLVPQPPGDFSGERVSAVYEANPEEFGQRYPRLDTRSAGNTICVDLWFHLSNSTGRVTSELDGTALDDVASQVGMTGITRSTDDTSERLEEQLAGLSSQIVAILARAERA